eukprot:GHVH01006740.1.p1 GENE.GHVH01006740.1~~GHVH01006740.1.p1  ORF type:complete len:1327 (-),score=183.76 GHVH01006740.1:127-4107(-)
MTSPRPSENESGAMVEDDRSLGVTPFTSFQSKLFNHFPYYLLESASSHFLTVVAEVPSPMIHVTISVPTTTLNNKGLPHCLEHLIFIGSNDYPYGFLDDYSQRCMTNGTNAWTMPDRTEYTFESACPEGVYTLLPVYMDHILRPDLCEDNFHSEVQYISTTGEPKGVVYTEMVDRSETPADLIERTAQQNLYSLDCPYAYETGGIPKNILELTNDEVQRYHQQYYSWNRLFLTISGSGIDKRQVQEIVHKLEIKYSSNDTPPPPVCVNDGASAVPPQLEPLAVGGHVEVVNYASADLNTCEIGMFWRGPKGKDTFLIDKLSVLSDYLTADSTAPLIHSLVNKNQVCGCLSFSVDKFSVSKLCWSFEGVELKDRHAVIPLLYSELKLVCGKPLNSARLADAIASFICDIQRAWEASPHEMIQSEISDWAVTDLPCGNSRKNMIDNDILVGLPNRLNFDHRHEILKNTTEQEWCDLLRTWFLDIDCCLVVALPSALREQEIVAEKNELKIRNLSTWGASELEGIERRVTGDLKRTKDEASKMMAVMPPIVPDEVTLNIFNFPMYSNMSLPNLSTSSDDRQRINYIGNDITPERKEEINDFLTYCPYPLTLTHVEASQFAHFTCTIRTPQEMWGSADQLGLVVPELNTDENQKGGVIRGLQTAGQKGQFKARDERKKFVGVGSAYFAHTVNNAVEDGETLSTDSGCMAAFLPQLLFDLPLVDGTSHELFIARLSSINADYESSLGLGGSDFCIGHGSNNLCISLDCPKQYATKGLKLLSQAIFLPEVTKRRLKEIAEPVYHSAGRERVDPSNRLDELEKMIMYPQRDPANAAGATQQYDLAAKMLKRPSHFAKRMNALLHDILIGDATDVESYLRLAKRDHSNPQLVLNISMNLMDDNIVEKLNDMIGGVTETIKSLFDMKRQADPKNLTIKGVPAGQYVPTKLVKASKMGLKLSSSLIKRTTSLLPGAKAKAEERKAEKMEQDLRSWSISNYDDFKDLPLVDTLSLREAYSVIPRPLRYRRYRESRRGAKINRVCTAIDGAASSYYRHTVKLSADDVSYMNASSLLVMCNYLSFPLFEAVREGGYSYGVYLYASSDFSQMRLEISPASDLPSALEASLKLLKNFIEHKTLPEEPSEALLRGQSSAICQLLSKQETLHAALQKQAIDAMHDLPGDSLAKRLIDIRSLSQDQMMDLSKPLISKFFNEPSPTKPNIVPSISSSSIIDAPQRSSNYERNVSVSDVLVVLTSPSELDTLNDEICRIMRGNSLDDTTAFHADDVDYWLRNDMSLKAKNLEEPLQVMDSDLRSNTEEYEEGYSSVLDRSNSAAQQ